MDRPGENKLEIKRTKIASPMSHFTLETHRLGHYLFRRISDLPPSKLAEFCGLVANFIRKSGEHDATVEKTVDKLSKLILDKPDYFAFWTVENEFGILKGYVFAEVETGEYGELELKVHHAYVHPSARFANILQEYEKILVPFARKKGAITMVFQTQRMPSAFSKKISDKWYAESVVMRRCL